MAGAVVVHVHCHAPVSQRDAVNELLDYRRVERLNGRVFQDLLDQLGSAVVFEDVLPSLENQAGVTFDTFQQRTEDEAEWLKAGGPYRDAEIGKAEVGNGRADCTQRRIARKNRPNAGLRRLPVGGSMICYEQRHIDRQI